ncbi:MAG TPA: hypothetical protein VFJ94_15620 [Intrasporangium sp.]|uniref:hypothetical protein n=1 Tax=Intrasporangium sp. TaxID=1925024 RepID=UPI002D79CA4C|nr:hypothetical protein [Intrasporangium sp.]HET7399943.1 hypothetical protein [Intrasporangium sp.]
MFRTLVGLIPNPPTPAAPWLPSEKANAVLSVHPLQLSRWLEEMWSQGGIANPAWQTILSPGGAPPGGTRVPLGDPAAITATSLPQLLLNTMRSGIDPKPKAAAQPFNPASPFGTMTPPPVWEHLLYAYLIEATGVFEILGEVVRRFAVGESLPTPSVETLVWARNTEQLFFRDPPLFGMSGLMTSQLRPDARINRRNVYWRMFGLDLPHPPARGVDDQPWKRNIGTAGNTRFLELWNELLRQVWLGIENDKNSSGTNATDATYIGYLCQTLGEMLQLRRRGGMISQEEFAYVTMLSWFHLTVESDTSIVADLNANAGVLGNPADRLASIGRLVGVVPSRQARELFELADLVSTLMWLIELGMFNATPNATLLYKRDGVANPKISETMNRIIDLWQSGTGERVKDLAVSTRRPQVDTRSAQPTRLPGGLVPVVSPTSNGHGSTVSARP